MDCIFCKIINKEIPNYTVYEDDYTVAFLDVHPCSKGHTIVVPKKHFETLWDMNTETFDLVAHSLRFAAGRVQARLKPDGMNIGINNGSAAGQAVPHVHWHIIPRYNGDGGGSMHSIVKSKEEVEVQSLAQLFNS